MRGRKEIDVGYVRRFLICGVAAVLLSGIGLALAPWTLSSGRAEPPAIRLGYGAAAEEQLYLLLAKPELGKNYGKSYKLEATRFQSSTQRSQAFEADAIDIASSGAVGVLFAAAEGVKGKVIASLARESPRGFATAYYVKAESPIQMVPDAKGKIVGINGFATDGQLWLKSALARHNLSDSDVTITPVPFPAMAEALKAGKIDIGEFPQPFAEMLEKDMKVRKLFDSQYGMSFEQELIVFMAKDAFLKQNAPAVRGLLQDLQAATRFYLDRPRKARQLILDAKGVRLDPEIYLNMKDYYRDPTLRPDTAALQRVQDVMIQTGFSKKRADISAMVDASYLPN
jgi:ABC-type nitrate/sulfonate/bicarbonate transport system substrate-binding protein